MLSTLLASSQLPPPTTQTTLPTSPTPPSHLASPIKLYVKSSLLVLASLFQHLCIHPRLCHACVPTHAFETYLNRLLLTIPPCRIPSSPVVVTQALHTDVIPAKDAAGKSVVMADSGAGLLRVTEEETGTRVPSGHSVARTRRVARTATMLKSADVVARGFAKAS